MISSFADKATELVWKGERNKKIPNHVQDIGRRKLRMLNSAVDISDLKIPPANRLDKLGGKLKSFYSIRINNQWRIIFTWSAGNAFEVQIIDYH